MEGGRDWWLQITAAIDQVEYLVLVMTEAALKSPVVRREWRYARQQGTCIVPVVAVPPQALSRLLDSSGLAGWMRRAHFVDPAVPEQWTRFIRTLEAPCTAQRVPMMAEVPPDHLVQRPRELAALRSHLLDPHGEPRAVVAALIGAGGCGKTMLARAFCHDDDVQDAFHDGILWVTLGEDPGDLASKLEDLIVAMSGQPSRLSTLEARQSRLREVLVDRSVLFVVDDLWNAAHLEPFLVVGERSALLITTRDSATAPRSAAEISVKAMAPREAAAVLRQGLPPGEAPAFARLAKRLGQWPLLLGLVNGALRERIERSRDSLPGALDHVDRVLTRRGLTGFDARDVKKRSQAVAKTIDVSLDLLDDAEQARLRELAVFPEDVDVPLATVELLWRHTGGLDEIDSEELLQRLFRLSLLSEFDLATRRLRLHDIIRAYLRGDGGPRLAQLDLTLVRAYGADPPERCADGPHDGYYFKYLLWHLGGAGFQPDVQRLLLDYRWIEAKLLDCGIEPLLDDYRRFAREPGAVLLGQALRLSAHVLAHDPDALLSQLLARIDASAELGIATQLSTAAQSRTGAPWLCPLTASLTRPGGPLVQTLEGHTDWIDAVAVTPDGRRVVSGARDGQLKIWDLHSGQATATLEAHDGQITAIAVTSDGERVVSAGYYDATVKVWDLESGERLGTLKTEDVQDLAVTPDGTRLVSASDDGTLTVWDLTRKRRLARIEAHDKPIHALAMTPQGRCVVSASDDGTLKVWDWETGTLVGTPGGDGGRTYALAVTPDGALAVSAGRGRTVKLWNLTTGENIATLEGHDDWVYALAVTPDGRYVVSGSRDRTLKVWNLEQRREVVTLTGHRDCVTAVAVTPDGQHVISSSGDATLKVWSLERARTAARRAQDDVSASALAVTPTGGRAVSGSFEGPLTVWDIKHGRAVATLAGHADWVTAVAMTPDGRRVVSGSRDRTLRVWDVDSGQQRFSVPSDWITALAVSPDGKSAVSGSYGGTVTAWDLERGEQMRALGRHDNSVHALVVTPDGTQAVSGDHVAGVFKRWDLATGQELSRLDGGDDHWIDAVAVAPDGKLAVSGSNGGDIVVWDVASGAQLAAVAEQQDVKALAISPDGKRVVWGLIEGAVKVFDLEAKQVLAAFYAERGVLAVACTDDAVVARCADGSIHFLELRENRAVRDRRGDGDPGVEPERT